MLANTIQSGNKVSVVIPNYNYAHYLEGCVNSVFAQTYTNFEVIIIDDCSTDNSIEILNKIKESNPVIILFNTENKGVCYSRNQGIEQSTGEYICFVDPDDYWYPDKLKEQIATIQSANGNICFTDINIVSDNNVVHLRKHSFKKYNYSTLLKRNFVPLSSVMISSDFLGEIRFRQTPVYKLFTENLLKKMKVKNLIHEDYAFFLQLFRKPDVKAIHISKPYVGYRLHGANYSKQYRKKILSLYCIYKNCEGYNTIKSVFYTFRISILATIKNFI